VSKIEEKLCGERERERARAEQHHSITCIFVEEERGRDKIEKLERRILGEDVAVV